MVQFDQLVRIVLPGGSLGGPGDKLFSLPDSFRSSVPSADGIHRFEGGVHVDEFRDLRANARSVLYL